MNEPPKVILAPGETEGDWITPEGTAESWELRLLRFEPQRQRFIGWQACLRAMKEAEDT